MSKLVCTNCQRELRPHLNGVNVVEYANFGPYKIWSADEWKCPECGLRVITGFSQEAHKHYQAGFSARLTHAWTKPGLLRHNFESGEQRAQFGAIRVKDVAERLRGEKEE